MKEDINMDDTVEKLAIAISSIRDSLTCSVCHDVCSDPRTPRCGHPFCQKCIGKVMVKRSARCPMCNGTLTRRTVNRNDQLENIIAHFFKIERAIKADIHVNIADYQIHPQKREAATENVLNLFPKTYLPAQGSSKRNKVKPRIISDTTVSPSNSILSYISNKQKPSLSSFINQTNKTPNRKTDNSDSSSTEKATNVFLKNIPENSDSDDNIAQETREPKQRGKVKSLQTASKARKKQRTDDQDLKFKRVHERVRERIINTSSASEKRAEDPVCDSTSEKIKNVKASAEEAKKTWSRIQKFGKEMRPLKKRSLNVSIESKSHYTPILSNQKITSAKDDLQEIFVSVPERKPSDLDHSVSNSKEEKNLASRLSNKEVNDIIGFGADNDFDTVSLIPQNCETDFFTPLNIIDTPSDEKQNLPTKEYFPKEELSENLKRPDNQDFKRSISKPEELKVAMSSSEQVVEDSNPEEEQENSFPIKRSLSLKKQTSDESYQISPEVPKSASKIPSINNLIEPMNFPLEVNSVQFEMKSSNNKMNQGSKEDELVFQSSIPGNEHLKKLKVTSKPCNGISQSLTTELPLKGIPALNHQSTFAERSEYCRLSLTEVSNNSPQVQSIVVKRSQLDESIKCSERKGFVPFKKLGKIFKKQRRIPFYYLGQLSKTHNLLDKNNLTVLTPLQCEKYLKKNILTTNLSDSGSRARANLSPENSKANDSVHSSHPTSSGTVMLLSPQNDSQLKHLSIESPRKEGRFSVHRTSLITGKDQLEYLENSMVLRGSSFPNLETQRSVMAPKAKKNIAIKFAPLREEPEEVNKEEPIGDKVIQKHDYKKLLDGSDFDIDTAQFKELADVSQFVTNDALTEELAEKRKEEEPTLFQDSDSGSIVPCSLVRFSKKQRFLEDPKAPEHLIQAIFPQSSNFTARVPHFKYPGAYQPNPQIVECHDFADRFFDDVIEKSKHIRTNTSIDIVEADTESSKEIQPNCDLFLQSGTTEPLDSESKTNEGEDVKNSINSVKNIKSSNEPESTTELLDYKLEQKELENLVRSECIKQIELDSRSISDSLQAHVQNVDSLNSDSDKENAIQNLDEIELSQPVPYSVKLTKTLSTTVGRVENLEAKEADRIPEDEGEICKTSALETRDTMDKQSQVEQMLDVLGTKGNATLQNFSLNISEEQLMLIEFEKELFSRKKTHKDEDIFLLPDGLKTPTTSISRAGDKDSRCEKGQIADAVDVALEVIENIPQDSGKSSQKVTYDKDPSDFSPIYDIDSSISEVKKPFVRPSLKRKSCPLYHSTPKVSKTKATRQRYATSLNVDIFNSSLQKPGKSTEEPVFEKSVSEKPKLCFVCSGLSSSQIETVKKLSKLVNADFISTFNPNVTHVIVKVTGLKNSTEKTLKYLQGIAYRKWVVGVKWAYDSFQESKLLNEEKYEAVDNLTFEEGPKKSRLRTKDIFEGITCLCQGPFKDVSVEDYSDLLIHTGATIVRTMEDLAAEKQKIKIIIVQPDHWDEKTIKEWFKKTKAVPVEHEWIVECISQYKLISLFDYLQAIPPQDAAAVGFPEELLEEGSYSEYED